jgi:hypothetical protein
MNYSPKDLKKWHNFDQLYLITDFHPVSERRTGYFLSLSGVLKKDPKGTGDP